MDYNQNTWRLIDHEGRFVSDARFDWGTPFSDGLAATDRGYVNRQGEMVIVVIQPQFAYNAGPFHRGLALVCFGCRD